MPLTDEQMATLVGLAGHQTPAEIARTLAAPYFTIHKAVQRVRRQGWATPLVYLPCIICGRLVASATTTRRTICRSDECVRAKAVQRSRAFRGDHPGHSTAYVREWRQRNPAKELARQIASYDARRGKPSASTPEQKRQHSVVAGRGQRRRNDETRELATNHGDLWSGDEEQYIVDHPELTNAAIAIDLGRTARAVHHRRGLMRKRQRSEQESSGAE